LPLIGLVSLLNCNLISQKKKLQKKVLFKIKWKASSLNISETDAAAL